VATFNILHGRSLDDGQVSLPRLVEACARLDADVLCLQEVDRGQTRSSGVDQTAAVAEGTGARCWRFEPAPCTGSRGDGGRRPPTATLMTLRLPPVAGTGAVGLALSDHRALYVDLAP
jgi:endonuclease/exonuclease/phosphatase family metal-dependent hydrolase